MDVNCVRPQRNTFPHPRGTSNSQIQSKIKEQACVHYSQARVAGWPAGSVH